MGVDAESCNRLLNVRINVLFAFKFAEFKGSIVGICMKAGNAKASMLKQIFILFLF